MDAATQPEGTGISWSLPDILVFIVEASGEDFTGLLWVTMGWPVECCVLGLCLLVPELDLCRSLIPELFCLSFGFL